MRSGKERVSWTLDECRVEGLGRAQGELNTSPGCFRVPGGQSAKLETDLVSLSPLVPPVSPCLPSSWMDGLPEASWGVSRKQSRLRPTPDPRGTLSIAVYVHVALE